MMTTAEAKAYVNLRYKELTEDNPLWLRPRKVNLIITELRYEYNFTLTTPTGHPIFHVREDAMGVIYEVTGLVE